MTCRIGDRPRRETLQSLVRSAQVSQYGRMGSVVVGKRLAGR
jgi:hypothetical protein